MKAVTVSSTEYTNSHGKAPRGTGYWMFEVTFDSMAALGKKAQFQVPTAMTYTEAKKWVLAEMNKRALITVRKISLLP